jgi:hypothetical protein
VYVGCVLITRYGMSYVDALAMHFDRNYRRKTKCGKSRYSRSSSTSQVHTAFISSYVGCFVPITLHAITLTIVPHDTAYYCSTPPLLLLFLPHAVGKEHVPVPMLLRFVLLPPSKDELS